MTNALSLYLDVLRFGAAFTVFVSHFANERFSGGLFWQMQPYGHTAVLVFFVLSGFVIAWVAETRERTLEEYSLSRLARLYSVIVPAFLITAILDHIGTSIDSRLYRPEFLPEMSRSPLDMFLGYALSAMFLGASWTLTVLPGSDLPYTTLNYEAWYYILFGVATFLRGRRRMAVLAAAALLAGPKVLLLFPIWLMGMSAWRWRAAPLVRHGALLVCAALSMFAALEAAGGQKLFAQAATRWLPHPYSPYDYLVGLLVAVLIIGLANTRLPMPGTRVQHRIRFLAGTTFGLYLLHFPLLNFFATVLPGPPDGTAQRIFVFALPLAVAIALSHVIERQKGPLKRALRSALDALCKRRPVLGRQGLSD
jgi:peptidoglycan/LPS O-acetylase OafA/YrhL